MITCEKTKYPLIFVHGMFGWGENEGINKKAPYWGATTGSLTEYLSGEGIESYAASTGPMSSAWDQACELYAQLRGTRVDYGENHSKIYGHRRYGRIYKKPLFENWSKEKKVHLIGHSFGGNTIRLLAHLLKNGAPEEIAVTGEETSPLFKGGQEDLVCSITTICSPLNGTDTYEAVQRYKLMGPTRILTLIYTTSVSRTKLHGKLLDFHLEQMGVHTTEEIKDIKPFFKTIRDLYVCKESIDYDMCEKGAEELNALVKIVPSVYYFSFCYNMLEKNKKGKLVPKNTKIPILSFTSRLVIKYGQKTNKPSDGNDGLVGVDSAKYPKNQPYKMYAQDEPLASGIWNVMPVRKGDHGTPIGLFADKEETHKFYNELISLLSAAEHNNISHRESLL